VRDRTSTHLQAIRGGPTGEPNTSAASAPCRFCSHAGDFLGAPERSALCLPGSPDSAREFRDRCGMARLLILAGGGTGPAQIAVAIVTGLKRRDHDAIGRACIEWPTRRQPLKFQSAGGAPALQLDSAAAPGRFVKQIEPHRRLVIYVDIIITYPTPERTEARYRLHRRVERKLVIDLTRHAGSGTRTFASVGASK
jgi:hypothetical protein